MLVSDYDDTFYINEKDVQINIKSINKFINEGNIFVIATGRSFTQIKREIFRFSIRYSYLICNDGALIFNHRDELIYRKDIDNKSAKSIIDILESDSNITNWYIDNGVIKTKEEDAIVNGIIALVKDEQKALKTLKDIETKYKDVHGYLVRSYLNITDVSVSKGNGIKILNETLNIKDENIYPIGNDINDISMIKMYDGYMMKDSTKALKEYTNKVCSSVYELIDNIRTKKN